MAFKARHNCLKAFFCDRAFGLKSLNLKQL